jgi:glutamyl-tRNA reductase
MKWLIKVSNIGSSLFLLLAPDSEEAQNVLNIYSQNKDKLNDKNIDKDLELINSNKDLLVSYFVASLKTEERERIIKYLYKYKNDYDNESYNLAIKNLLHYKYNIVIRQAVKSLVRKMINQWKDKLIMEINDNPELNNEQSQDFIKLIEGLYE